MRRRALSILLALCSPLHGACETRQVSAAALVEGSRAALRTYTEIASAAYGDSVSGSRTLAMCIDELLAAPSPASLAAARDAWRKARVPYAQTEVFRFYDGPIDAVERWVNTWPIDENYVESAAPAERPGLIDDPQRYPELSAAVLARLNMSEGETSVSTGYHVIEFLLWGRDTNPDGPGARTFGDFVQAMKPGVEQAAIERRRSYLRSAAALLVQQLEQVAQAWNGDYRAKFSSLPPREALGLAIKGMGSLSGPELSGERLTVPYETKDQENEHSCFSDNTLADLAGDALGIQNVCLGHYQRADGGAIAGAGICDALQLMAAEPASRLRRQTGASLSALRAIPEPFDRAILGADDAPGRKAIAAAIQALRDQADTLSELAQTLQVRLTNSARAP
jgi:putative iron-regulated protein